LYNDIYTIVSQILDSKMGSKNTFWPTFDARVVGFSTFLASRKNMKLHDFFKLADVRFWGDFFGLLMSLGVERRPRMGQKPEASQHAFGSITGLAQKNENISQTSSNLSKKLS